MSGIYEYDKVNEHYPEALMIDAMKVWSLPKGKEHKLQECCESGEYFAQIKKDGIFYQFNRTPNHSYLFSRNTSVDTGLLTEKLANVPHIKHALDCLPQDTVVIGEVYIPGGTSKNVTSIMGCLPKKAIERQEQQGNVHYYLHDIIAFNGVSLLGLPAEKRYEVLAKLYEEFDLNKHEFIELAEVHTDNIFELIGSALENGEEGVVLKKKDCVYSPDKKPAWSMIKCKQVDYADVVCMGFEDATKEYTGTELDSWQYWEVQYIATGHEHSKHMGDKPCWFEEGLELKAVPITKPYYHNWKTSIIIGAYDNDGNLKRLGTVSSGLTDSIKQHITNNPKNYIGKVLKVQCMELDKKAHTLRHPIFKEFRIDKNAEECTIKDIF